MLHELRDEVLLGQTARLIPLAGRAGSLVAEIILDRSPHHTAARGLMSFISKDQGGHQRHKKMRGVEVRGKTPLRTEDRLLSDLDQVHVLCVGIQNGEPDPKIVQKLDLLVKRLAGGKPEPASASPPTAEPERTLPPSRLAAHQSYQRALEANPELKGQSLPEVWRWLKEEDPDKSDYVLPREGTWLRYLSEARRYFGGRSSGRPRTSDPGSFNTKKRERFMTGRRDRQP